MWERNPADWRIPPAVLQHDVPDTLIAPTTTYCYFATITGKRGDLINRRESIGTIGTTG